MYWNLKESKIGCNQKIQLQWSSEKNGGWDGCDHVNPREAFQ